MRIAAWVDKYPPDWCAGSEMSLHETLLGLQRLGHEVCVYRRSPRSYEVEGIPVRPALVRQSRTIAPRYDVLFVQLDNTRQACDLFRDRLPIVHFVHVYEQLKSERVQAKDAQLVVMNSQSMSDRLGYEGRQIVVPPIVDPDRYRVPRGDRITLINLNENKGGDLFWSIAKAMPHHSFLAVKGAYRNQIVPRVVPPNVKLIEHTPHQRDIYAQTRVLLMPSQTETWGRTALEAASSGIPTIAHRSDGLAEALGASGRFANRDTLSEWVEEIRRLDNPDEYQRASSLSLARSRVLSEAGDLRRLEAEILSVVQDFRK